MAAISPMVSRAAVPESSTYDETVAAVLRPETLGHLGNKIAELFKIRVWRDDFCLRNPAELRHSGRMTPCADLS